MEFVSNFMGFMSKLRGRQQEDPQPGRVKYRGGQTIYVGQPSEYPDEMVARLKSLFKSSGCVQNAYLVHVFDPAQGDPPHNMILIAMHSESPRAFHDFVPDVGAILRQVCKEGVFVDVVDIATTGNFGTEVMNSTEPFYP